MYIKADSDLATLSPITKRFFHNTIEGNFIDWANEHYSDDMPQIVEDLTPFIELNATEKLLQRLGEFDEIIDKNNGQISAGVKQVFSFHKVFALKTTIKTLVDLLNL